MSELDEIRRARADFRRAAALEAALCAEAEARAGRALALLGIAASAGGRAGDRRAGARPLAKLEQHSSLVYRQPPIGRNSRSDAR